MTAFIIILLAVAAYWAASFYLAKSSLYLTAAEPAWDRMYSAAMSVVRDDTMPLRCVQFAAGAVMCAGCGCLTMRIMLDRITGRIGRHPERARPGEDVMKTMSAAQQKTFTELVTNAIYYDSLRSPALGWILRRFFLPWLEASVGGRQRAPMRTGVVDLAASSRRAIESRPEGVKALALAH